MRVTRISEYGIRCNGFSAGTLLEKVISRLEALSPVEIFEQFKKKIARQLARSGFT